MKETASCLWHLTMRRVFSVSRVSKVGSEDTLDEVRGQIPPVRLTLSCTTAKGDLCYVLSALRGGMHPPAACLVSTATSAQTVKSTHHQATFASVNIQRCRPIQDYVTLLVVYEKLIQIKFVKKLEWLIVSLWVKPLGTSVTLLTETDSRSRLSFFKRQSIHRIN
ncbi:hypothetical protein DPX16_9749 [Anabarilius grahami]|uniref:Uncharacterized protein n=1 Tax=Anabarilius grahami TaxID=495550 RepID=A0A3N0Y3I8_ANAGA|nr:hypothetical protein DPX16_9749 [Anabarilius grahami]